jgi:GT2 family glycosyltransferase
LDFLKVKKPLILVPKLEGKKGRYFFVRPLINISNFLNLKWKKGIISKKDLIQPAFSAIFIKKGVFEKLQGLDEKFFVYFTDVEFFRRFYNFYKKEDVYFIEQSFIHQEGSVLNSRKNTFLRYYDWARGFFLYFLKYGTPLEKILSLPFFLIFLKRAMLNYLR